MTRFHFERPDGPPNNNAQNILIHLNEFVPPEGYDGVGAPPVQENPILAIFPPLADNTYQFYKFYQIRGGQVPTTQTNMPLVTIDTLGAGILQQASGFDIREFDNAGVPLDYNDQSVDPVTGDIIVWVNVTTVKDSEFIQSTFGKLLDFDNSSTDTWDVNFKRVYHLSQVPAGAASIKDSTSNGGHATPINGPTQINGQIGKALFFDNTATQAVQIDDQTLADLFPNFTISLWFNPEAIAPINGSDTMLGSFDNPNGWMFRQQFANAEKLQFRNSPTESVSSDVDIIVTDWQMATVTFDGTDLRLYYNGERIGLTVPAAQPLPQSFEMFIGTANLTDSGRFFEGGMDELTISDNVRSDDFDKTKFNNENDNDAFWFRTPLLENGEDNFLVDDQGRNIVEATIP